MNDPHPKFTEAMMDAYRRAKSEARYNAPKFLEMLHERLGYDTAMHLIHSSQPSIGFTHLWERKRLDLTVEALVLRPEWSAIFTETDLKAARKRLEEYHYQFPKDSWNPNQIQPPATPEADDLGAPPPERVESKTYRILRDTELARRVKALHKYQCQICGHTIQLPNGSMYAEAHHIQPLGDPHNGPDVIGNILCVCPNHHAELDYRVSKLSLSSIRTVAGHSIAAVFVDYHNRLFNEATKQP